MQHEILHKLHETDNNQTNEIINNENIDVPDENTLQSNKLIIDILDSSESELRESESNNIDG